MKGVEPIRQHPEQLRVVRLLDSLVRVLKGVPKAETELAALEDLHQLRARPLVARIQRGKQRSEPNTRRRIGGGQQPLEGLPAPVLALGG